MMFYLSLCSILICSLLVLEGKSRGILSEAVSIIEDASQIPMNFLTALQSSAGSSAQAQEDQEHIENLRGLIGDLLKVFVSLCKQFLFKII